MMKLIWVLGAQGQIGRVLQRYILEYYPTWQVRFFTRQLFDLTNYEQMHAHFLQETPQTILNLAAYTAVDKAETAQKQAIAINAEGITSLATLCAKYHIPLIDLSTDYVFSGDARVPYQESHPTCPQNIYGQSKCMGEEAIRRIHPQHIILRTSWVFSEFANSFVYKILTKAQTVNTVSVVADQIGAPTAAENLVNILCKIIISIANQTAKFGTYHYRDQEICSWFWFTANIFNQAAQYPGWENLQVAPIFSKDFTTLAKRPTYSVLSVNKLTQDFALRPYSHIKPLKKIIHKICTEAQHVCT